MALQGQVEDRQATAPGDVAQRRPAHAAGAGRDHRVHRLEDRRLRHPVLGIGGNGPVRGAPAQGALSGLPPEMLRRPKAPQAGGASFARISTAEGRNMPYKDPDKERAGGRRRYERITAERLSRGMCPRCGEARPVADHSLCQCCGEKRRQAERARCAKARAAGILYAGRDAERCRRSASDRSKRRDRARREAGLCTRCGKATARGRPHGVRTLPRGEG